MTAGVCVHSGRFGLWPQSSCRFTNPVILLSCTGVDVLTYIFPFIISIEDLPPMLVMRSMILVAAILLQLRTLMHKHSHVYTRVQEILTVVTPRVPGDGDCGFRALLVAMLLQVCCCGPAMGASMAACIKALFDALPEWTRTPAVIAGYSTLKVTVLDTCAPPGCQCGCLMTA